MEETGFQHFWDLVAWQEARAFKNFIRGVARTFPAEEKFRLTDQITRASRSIGAQISEGHGRFSFKDQIHFCIVARASLNECLNHLFDALDEAYIDQSTFDEGKQKFQRVESLINGYIKYLRKRLENPNQPN